MAVRMCRSFRESTTSTVYSRGKTQERTHPLHYILHYIIKQHYHTLADGSWPAQTHSSEYYIQERQPDTKCHQSSNRVSFLLVSRFAALVSLDGLNHIDVTKVDDSWS